jgi:hypothetical protein
MIRMTIVLIAACIVILAVTPVNAQERSKEPRSILCQGKAVSPVPGPIFAEVSLSATIDFDRTLGVVLQDDKGKQELVGRQEVLGANDLDVYVRTGCLTVVEGTGSKVALKMLWQKAGMSEDFIGLAITLGYTSVLQVDSWDYGKEPKGTQMPFNFFDGLNTSIPRDVRCSLRGSDSRAKLADWQRRVRRLRAKSWLGIVLT